MAEETELNPLEKWRLENPDHVSGPPKTPWEKLREKNTRKTAIDAQCCHCVGSEEGEPMPPNYRKDIRNCTDTKCPLHDWRPYRGTKQ